MNFNRSDLLLASFNQLMGRAVLGVTMLACSVALAQNPPPSGSTTGAQSVLIRGCVIDADNYAPVGVSVRAFMLDGVAAADVRSNEEGRFVISVPPWARVHLMTASGQRSSHSAVTFDTKDRDVNLPGCLLHFH